MNKEIKFQFWKNGYRIMDTEQVEKAKELLSAVGKYHPGDMMKVELFGDLDRDFELVGYGSRDVLVRNDSKMNDDALEFHCDEYMDFCFNWDGIDDVNKCRKWLDNLFSQNDLSKQMYDYICNHIDEYFEKHKEY